MGANLIDLTIIFGILSVLMIPFLLVGWMIETIMERRERRKHRPMATFTKGNKD